MTSASKTLGRGLESLLKGRATPLVSPAASNTLPIDAIQPGPSQPRAQMRPEPLEELAASIKANGVIQPIVVRAIGGTGNRYEIVAGERRWQAAKLAGLTEIPAVVRELSDQDAVAVALIENIQREDLTPAEEARSLQRLLSEFSLTHQEVATAVGRSRTAVTNLLRLLDLPAQVLDLIESRRLAMGHARALLGLEKDYERTKLALRVAEQGLSVRQTEELVRKAQDPVAPRPARKADLSVVTDVIVSDHAHVRLHQGPHGMGRLVVEFTDSVTRDEIVRALKEVLEE
jgi:ParB family chromosome partitioning protein